MDPSLLICCFLSHAQHLETTEESAKCQTSRCCMGSLHRHSLKRSVRQRRGSGHRVLVKSSTPIPKNWQSFLCVDQNKTELYHYLSQRISPAGKELFSMQDTSVMLSHECSTQSALAPCDHEEADTRLFCMHCIVHKVVIAKS